MSTIRQDPLSHRPLEVDEDGTIPTWLVTWAGDEISTVSAILGSSSYLSEEKQRRLAELRTKYNRRMDEPVKPYDRKGFISNRITCFIHYEDALSEYNWIKRILMERGDWDRQQTYLTITDGERASFHDLFESTDGGYWWA